MDADRRRRRQLAAHTHRPITARTEDLLAFDAYATAIAELIDDPTVGRSVIAVNGSAGSGKSSLGHLVENALRDRYTGTGERPIFWFDAWMHDDADNLAGAFLARLLLAIDGQRGVLRRWFRPLPLRLIPPGEWIKRTIPLVLFAAALVGVLLGLLEISVPRLLVEYSPQAAGGVGLIVVLTRFVFTTADSLAAFVRDPGRVAGAGALDRVRSQLEALVDQATPPDIPFVMIVDDLDRVRPPASVDVLEAIDQLLPGHVAVVILAEVDALVASAEIKYAELAKRSPSYGHRYIERMIPVQFDLPWRNKAWPAAFLEARLEAFEPGENGGVAGDPRTPGEVGGSPGALARARGPDHGGPRAARQAGAGEHRRHAGRRTAGDRLRVPVAAPQPAAQSGADARRGGRLTRALRGDRAGLTSHRPSREMAHLPPTRETR